MKTSLTYLTSFSLASILMTGCLDQEETAFEKRVREDNQIISTYLADNQIETERLNSGVHLVKLQENSSGTAVDDKDIVSIFYTLRTLDGKLVDSLSSSGPTVRFYHAQEAPNALFPRGINIGVGHMREGEKYRLYIPSYQAFETYSFGQLLPREAILIADVEVQGVESSADIKEQNYQNIEAYTQAKGLEGVQELSSGIYYQSLAEGSGSAPKTGSLVKVSYKGYYLDEKVFDQSEENDPIEFFIGKKSVIPGFEEGISLMKKGGKARILIPSHLGFNGGVQVIPSAIRKDFLEEFGIRDLRPFEPVIFDVELIDVQS